MSERKVLNKYYPPDFDPTKIPKVKGPRNHTFNIRTMAPFNMRCNTCGEYIYKGKKFNSRKETVDGENYLGLHIFRFYIKCPRCVAEIAFKTDPESTDYKLEAGATRNFEASKTAMELAVKAQKEKEEEEMNNPMKVLENRTKQSRNEMERIENLEELRELNSRHAKVDHEQMIRLHAAYEDQLRQLQDREDEDVISKAFGRERVKRLADSDSDSDETASIQPSKIAHVSLGDAERPTDILVQEAIKVNVVRPTHESLKSLVRHKNSLKGIVMTKKSATNFNVTNVKSSSASVNTSEAPTPSASVSAATIQSAGDSGVVKRQEIGAVTVSLERNKAQRSESSTTKPNQASGALSLLGNYSEGSESD